jgi:hypothetical protein
MAEGGQIMRLQRVAWLLAVFFPPWIHGCEQCHSAEMPYMVIASSAEYLCTSDPFGPCVKTDYYVDTLRFNNEETAKDMAAALNEAHKKRVGNRLTIEQNYQMRSGDSCAQCTGWGPCK